MIMCLISYGNVPRSCEFGVRTITKRRKCQAPAENFHIQT
jgi:hypothetical protein